MVGKNPNKTMKYIDIYKLWYDEPNNPNYNNWVNVEGIKS